MQPTTQLPHEQKQSMSWGQFIPSTLFAFWGTGFITTFLILPLIMYKSIFADKTQIALYESIIDTTGTALQLIILLFFIFKYEPAKTLLLPSFDFSVLKKISYIRILVHYLFIKYPFQFIRITTRISRCIRRTIVCVKLTYFKPISNIVTYRVRNTYTHF